MALPDEKSVRSGGIRTHYDNLKVARNAPIEVIRAAYRALSAKYHPDHNPSSDQAARAMKIINAAYEVLSDPKRRDEHDQWIANMESSSIESAPPATNAPKPQAHPAQPTKPSGSPSARSRWEISERRSTKRNAVMSVAAFVLALAVGCGMGVYFWSSTSSTNSPTSRRGSIPTRVFVPAPASEPAPARPRYVRPSLAPNGLPWPLTSLYLTVHRAVDTADLSSLTVDNRQNTSDMLVKLFDRGFEHAVAVRFLPQRS